MTDNTLDTIRLARAQEALRQESEAFDQLKRHADRRLTLQIAIGWVAVVMIPLIALTCTYIIANNNTFSASSVTAATAALFVDVLGLLVSVWKVFLNPASIPRVEPVTKTIDYVAFDKSADQNFAQVGNRIGTASQQAVNRGE